MNFYDCFQITALIVFYAVFLGRAIQLKIKGVNPLALGVGKKGFERILEIFFVLGLLVWTLEVVCHSLHLKLHLFPSAFYIELPKFVLMKTAGTILMAAGLIIFVMSLISFGDSWRIGIDRRTSGGLVTTGIFSVTRNPIFLFLDLYLLGVWLIYPNFFFGIFALTAGVGIHSQIIQEERFLAERYGDEYQEYLKKVRRYF